MHIDGVLSGATVLLFMSTICFLFAMFRTVLPGLRWSRKLLNLSGTDSLTGWNVTVNDETRFKGGQTEQFWGGQTKRLASLKCSQLLEIQVENPSLVR